MASFSVGGALVANGDRAGPTGQELLAEFVQYGRQQPFEEIVRRYAGMVFNVCLRVTKDKHEAEDATQAVFLTLALQAKRGAEIKALGPWLQQVGKRLSLDTRRSKKRRKVREERHHDEQTTRRESIIGDAMPAADMDELKVILNEELQKLPSKYRLPLILHYYGGMSRDEMAVELNCKPSTLGVRIFRGREMLAGRLSGRGIQVSAGVLAVALGICVKRSIGEGLISATSYAASSMIAGHSGAGLASMAVIGLTRRAGSAMSIGKIKLATATAILAAASMGAGLKAVGILPDIRQFIGDQVRKMVSPVIKPLNRSFVPSLRAQSPAPAGPATVAVYVPPVQLMRPAAAVLTPPLVTPMPPAQTVALTPSTSFSGRSYSSWTESSGSTDSAATPVAVAESGTGNRDGDLITATSASTAGVGGGAGGGLVGPLKHGPELAFYHSSPASTQMPGVITAVSTDLFVTPSLKLRARTIARKSAAIAEGTPTLGSVAPATDSQEAEPSAISATAAGSTGSDSVTYAVPAVGGMVTETDGIVRGWGCINRTGTLRMDGAVVADGDGVNRTLDLSKFAAIHKDVTNTAAGGANGWYASSGGRLVLPLLPSTATGRGKAFVWGDDPNTGKPDLVNSVRLTLNGDDADLTAHRATLSLLAVDRTDGPDLTGIDGATIGLWEIDDGSTDVQSAEVVVRYNDWLVDELGARESSVQLWAYESNSWVPVDGDTYSLNTTDHLVSGSADDFSYFAVSVRAPEVDGIDAILAHPLAIPAAASVPEPAGIAVLSLLGASMIRWSRRR